MSEESKVKNLINAGATLAGGAAGGAIGFILGGVGGGTIGASVGGAVGSGLQEGIKTLAIEFSDRILSKRESERIGAAFEYSIAKYKDNLSKGYHVRKDDFFQDTSDSRSHSKEILEGVLLKVKDSYEEKKVKYFGYLYANAVFSDVDYSHINQIVYLAERISYRQFKILSLVGRLSEFNLRQEQYDTMLVIYYPILQDTFELDSIGLIRQEDPISHQASFLLGAGNIIPAKLVLSPIGRIMYQLMGLEEIRVEELEDILTVFKQGK